MANISTSTHMRWGLITTIFWSLVLFTILSIAQGMALIFAFSLQNPGVPLDQFDLDSIDVNDGFYLSIATIAGCLATLPFLAGIIKLKRGSNLCEYLGLTPINPKTTLKFVLCVLVFSAVFDLAKWALQVPVLTQFSLESYSSAQNLALYFAALCLFAPLVEELLCRGFMITGLENSFLGPVGAVLITSLAWASVHIQYDFVDIAFIFIMGCILGASRIMTGSIIPALWAHIANNVISYAMTALYFWTA
jgi:CAAX protease family protein